MTDWTRSTFLDLTSWTTVADPSGTSVVEAYGFDPANISVAEGEAIIIGLVLPRANDASELLDLSWGERQAALHALEESGDLFKVFGAEQDAFDSAVAILEFLGIEVLGSDKGFLTAPETRTIWVELDSDGFQALFGQQLLTVNDTGEVFWEGALSEPEGIPLDGLAVSPDLSQAIEPLVKDTVTLDQGPQSIGNAATHIDLKANDIAALYNFPFLSDQAIQAVETTVGLIEPGIGSALNDDRTFQEAVEEFLDTIGRPEDITTYTVDDGEQSFTGASGERSLDVGIIATVNPYSTIGLYNGATNDLFQTYQTAIFDDVNDPAVLSSSFGAPQKPTPDSPFQVAYLELFVDAALANRTLFIAAGDGGSSSTVGAGVPRVTLTQSSPYVVTVGGTSLTVGETAPSDPTLADLLNQFELGDPPVIWDLVAGGLKTMPDTFQDDDVFVEAVWNEYVLTGDTLDRGYLTNATGTGGVDPGVETPAYQTDYGLMPTVEGPISGIGRGIPDVAANAGGNMFYTVPNGAFDKVGGDGGTSASAPIWASLFQQINTIFEAEGLPRLGYSNDLLYQAAAIAPAAFNDVRLGNNVSTYVDGTTYKTPTRSGETMTIDATGIGYEAGEDYDLTTGLGSPNGALLADALSAIAHRELTGEGPGVLAETDDGTASSIDQALAIQVRTSDDLNYTVSTDGETVDLVSNATEDFAWTARFAQQTLQADFDPSLVRLFDFYEQGQILDATLAEGENFAVTLDGQDPTDTRAPLTNDFGFVEYDNAEVDASISLSRRVAVADTTGGADDQDFVIHTRQNTVLNLELQLYRVDDFLGRIDGILPGEEGYAEAAAARAYETTDGANRVDGAGYGEYASYSFTGVDNGDLIAMTLFTPNATFWAFSEENEEFNGEHIAHLWNYGHNTWGFEDARGGGDRDFNDLVVRFDFTGTDDALLT